MSVFWSPLWCCVAHFKHWSLTIISRRSKWGPHPLCPSQFKDNQLLYHAFCQAPLFHCRTSSFPRMADWAYMHMLCSGKEKQESTPFQTSHKLPPPVGISFHGLNGKLMAVLWLFPLVPVCSFQKNILRTVSSRANNGEANFHSLLRPRHQCDQAILKVLSRHRGDTEHGQA